MVRALKRGLLRSSRRAGLLKQACGQVLERLVQLLPDTPQRICTVTSARPREGRTSLVLNLAEVAGDAARPALVVDADLTAPRIHEVLGVARGPGLIDVLAGTATCDAALRPSSGNAGVHVLAAGEAQGATALFGNGAALQSLMDELRRRYAWVFIDTAPLLTAPTGATLARHTDGALLAARYGVTRGPLAAQGATLLQEAAARVLGVVLTQRRFVIPNYIYRRL